MKDKKIRNSADVSILLTIANTFGTFITLIIAIIGVRSLTMESYGIYLQVMFYMQITLSMLQLGIPKSIYYFMPRVVNQRRFVFHTLTMLNILGLSAMLFFILFRHLLTRLTSDPEYIFSIYFLAAYIFFSSNKVIMPGVLLSNNNGKVLFYMRILLSVIMFFSLAIPMFIFRDLYHVLWFLLIFHIFQYLLSGAVMLKTTPGSLSKLTDSECMGELFKYIMPLGLISIISIFNTSIDRFIVSFFMDVEHFAIYDRGAMQIPIISTLYITVGAVILPKLVEYYRLNKIDRFLEVWHQSINKVAMIIFPCVFFLEVFADKIITILYTERFGDSVSIFKITVLISLVHITAYGNIFNAVNRNKILLYLGIFSLFIKPPLCILLVKKMGANGPAAASLISAFTLFIVNVLFIKKYLAVKIKDTLPWFFLFKLTLSAGISGGIAGIFTKIFDMNNNIISIISGLVIYLLTYYLIIDYAKLINAEDKETVKKWTGYNIIRKMLV